jgi:hypothetical protein
MILHITAAGPGTHLRGEMSPTIPRHWTVWPKIIGFKLLFDITGVGCTRPISVQAVAKFPANRRPIRLFQMPTLGEDSRCSPRLGDLRSFSAIPRGYCERYESRQTWVCTSYFNSTCIRPK